MIRSCRPAPGPGPALAFALAALVAAGLLVIASAPVAAQAEAATHASGGTIVGQLPASTRSLALGGAVPLADRDPDLVFRNPALAGMARGMGLHLHHYRTGSRAASMSAGAEWLGGGAALGLRNVEYRGPHPGTGIRAARPGERMVTAPTQGIPVSETALTAAYGRVFKGFRVGASASWLHVRADAETDATAFVDLGVARALGPVTLGLSGGGLAPSLDLGPGLRRVPRWLAADAATRPRWVGPIDVAGAASVTLADGRRLEAGGGLEVGWWPVQGRTLVGRVGVGGSRVRGASPLALGAAFLGDAFTLEYAWRDLGDGRGLHGLGLRFR